MTAILGGLGAAICFAVATLASSRASRLIGPAAALGWVMLVGIVLAVPIVLVAGVPSGLDARAVPWLAVAGVGNVVGLFLEYAGLRTGKVALVASIASAEGAVAAVLAVIGGERLEAAIAISIVVVAIGVALTGLAPDRDGIGTGRPRRAILFGLAAAVAFGCSLYATGRIGQELTIPMALLPARLVGFSAITLPLAVASRLTISRVAAPLVIVAGAAEVGGFASFAYGAGQGIAVSSVLASQFASLAAVLAWLLFRERLSALQWLGVATVAAGVLAMTIASI